MAKPIHGLPGNSGHIHLSLTNLSGVNVFARSSVDHGAKWPDIAWLSDTGRFFLAGVLDALQSIQLLFAPNVNSYKRVVEGQWAPTHVSWGLEDRLASIRIIAPPTCKPSATRLEIRNPGADLHPHYTLAALLAAGWRGVTNEMEIPCPPLAACVAEKHIPKTLPRSLAESIQNFSAPESVAREIFDPDFIDHFTKSREHEMRLWSEAVTDWYVSSSWKAF